MRSLSKKSRAAIAGAVVVAITGGGVAYGYWSTSGSAAGIAGSASGSTQLTITQKVPLTGAVVVTTPQDVALIDARKGLAMFRKVNVPVLGLVENMSYYMCRHCGEREEIFGHGGGRRTAEMLGVPFLGEVPLDPKVVVGGDTGEPIVVRNPDAPAAIAFTELAAHIAAQVESGMEGHTHAHDEHHHHHDHDHVH